MDVQGHLLPGLVEGVSMSIDPVSTKLRFFVRVVAGDANLVIASLAK